MALALFGGSQKYADDENRIPIRGDPHVLVVGDPGLGKSQMLQVGNNHLVSDLLLIKHMNNLQMNLLKACSVCVLEGIVCLVV